MKPIYITAGIIVVIVVMCVLLTFMLGGMFYQPVILEIGDEG